jgi:hypothetical protein
LRPWRLKRQNDKNNAAGGVIRSNSDTLNLQDGNRLKISPRLMSGYRLSPLPPVHPLPHPDPQGSRFQLPVPALRSLAPHASGRHGLKLSIGPVLLQRSGFSSRFIAFYRKE